MSIELYTYQPMFQEHGGRLPVRICAVTEGSIIPVKNVLFTVINTDPKVPWLASVLEVSAQASILT